MAGVFTDNQPDFTFLAPGETKTFSQYWYPIQETGPVHQATLEAAVRLDAAPGAATTDVRVAVAVTRVRAGATVRVTGPDGRVLWELRADAAPNRPIVHTAQLPGAWQPDDLTVVVEHDGVAFARIDTPGAVFGEMSVVLGRPATATVRAADEVLVRVVEDPVRFLTDRPGAALAVLRTTASRLDGLTQYLVDVKRQFAGNDDHMAMIDRILDTLVHHQAPRPRTGSARDPEGHVEHEAH
jgi:hypothetical protein